MAVKKRRYNRKENRKRQPDIVGQAGTLQPVDPFKEELSPIQVKLLELLKEVDAICKKHKITYYLIGGTALGAVRHRGFLPWDDDADIVMTYPEFLKFEEVIDSELMPNRKFLTWQRYENYPLVFSKYINTDTTCVMNVLEIGLMLDIFVLRPIPNSERQREKYHKLIRLYGELVTPLTTPPKKCKLPDFLFYHCLSAIFGKKNVLGHIEKKLSGYKEEDCTHYSYGYPRLNVIYEKSIFEKPRYVQFEDTVLPVPTRAEEHFRILFGDDWVILPIVVDRTGHDAVVDTNRPYTEYMADYLHYMDADQFAAAGLKRKIWLLKARKKLLFTQSYVAELKALKEGLRMKNQAAPYIGEIRAMIKSGLLGDAMPYFSAYYDEQFSAQMAENEILVPISDELLYCAVLILILKNKTRKADALLCMREKKGDLDKDLSMLRGLIDSKRNIVLALESDDKKHAGKLIKEWSRRFPHDLDLMSFRIRLELAERKPNYERIRQLAEQGLDIHPECGDFHKYLGDVFYKDKDYDAAREHYNRAIEESFNGPLLLEARDALANAFGNC